MHMPVWADVELSGGRNLLPLSQAIAAELPELRRFARAVGGHAGELDAGCGRNFGADTRLSVTPREKQNDDLSTSRHFLSSNRTSSQRQPSSTRSYKNNQRGHAQLPIEPRDHFHRTIPTPRAPPPLPTTAARPGRFFCGLGFVFFFRWGGGLGGGFFWGVFWGVFFFVVWGGFSRAGGGRRREPPRSCNCSTPCV